MSEPAYAAAEKKHLLLDSRVVASAEGCRLALGKVRKERRNPFFVEDKPWEARNDNMYANLLRDPADGLYKCWYNPFLCWHGRSSQRKKRVSRETGLCYAVSEDGLHWERPDLRLVSFKGSKKNNIVMGEVHGACVRIDENDPDPNRRFKAFYKTQEHRTPEQWATGLMWTKVAVSPDGLRWTELEADMPTYRYKQADTHNNFVWHPDSKMWVAITRTWDRQPGERSGARRLVARMESTDFVKWDRPVDVMPELPEELGRRQPYAMPIFRYAGVYLGLVMMYHTGDPKDPRHDMVECELTWSRNTIHWERVCPGESIIPRGRPGAFDDHIIYGACSPVLLDDEMRLYYAGGNGPHGGPRQGGLGLARLRPDGFAGYEPIARGGTGCVVTTPVTCTGRTLRVSADAAKGDVRVSVLGARGLSRHDCRIIGDDVTDAPVQWEGGRDLARLVGKQVALQFELGNAKLYGFSFGN